MFAALRRAIDLGYRDAAGELFITGRVGDGINIGGAKLNPALIDDALLSVPGIADAALLSMPFRTPCATLLRTITA